MPFFVKTETFKKDLFKDKKLKNKFVEEHIFWVKDQKNKGVNIKSGYLIDKNQIPGGGGLLFIECNSYEEAIIFIKDDPMIKNNLVDWNLHEWIDVIT